MPYVIPHLVPSRLRALLFVLLRVLRLRARLPLIAREALSVSPHCARKSAQSGQSTCMTAMSLYVPNLELERAAGGLLRERRDQMA
jgi:hypothetical protein